MKTDEKNGAKVAVMESGDAIRNTGDILDRIADASYHCDANKLLIPKECLPEAFFDLSTGIAGEILQKCTNYGVQVAVVGDFSVYPSKSLRDFIRESNKHGKVLFLRDREEALEKLHGGT